MRERWNKYDLIEHKFYRKLSQLKIWCEVFFLFETYFTIVHKETFLSISQSVQAFRSLIALVAVSRK